VKGVTERNYKIDELARAAGMSPRTVRYYVQRGLLPAPAFRGKDTAYGHEHLVRLKAIRKLQEAYFPLDAIAAELEGRTPAELERFVEGKSPDATHAHARVERVERAEEEDMTPSYPTPPSARPPRDALRSPPRRSRHGEQVLRRIDLFPGVELTVAEDAPAKSVRLLEQMLEVLEAMTKVKEGERKR
jgi:DNA-binding transcriptional MerR regulator